MKRLVALLLIVPTLAGCSGGGGDAPDGDTADGEDAVPTLPEGLAMDGAEVVEYSDAKVTWRWEETLGPSAYTFATGTVGDSVETAFDAPPGVAVDVAATISWTTDDPALLHFRIQDGAGEPICFNERTVDYTSLEHGRACTGSREAAPEPGRWTVYVDSTTNLDADLAFTLHVTLEARPDFVLHTLSEMRPFEARAHDGVDLRGHVYLPDGDPPFATVLEFTPYWNTQRARSDDLAVEAGDRTTLGDGLGPFLDAGFAVAAVNPRGAGLSGGCMDHGGPLDVSDARTVIETLANQTWSNGRVGMFGKSWPAWTQYAAIASGAPSLKATVPMSGIVDAWSYVTENGASRSWPEFAENEALWISGVQAPTHGFVPENRPDHYTCPDHASKWTSGFEVLWDGDRTPFFEARDLREGIAGSSVPMLMSHGLWNSDVIRLTDPYIWKQIPHDDKHLVLGQWGHQTPERGGMAGFTSMAVSWFDHYLRDGSQVAATNGVEYQDTEGAWHTAAAWPPAGDTTHLFLSAGDLALGSEQVRASEASFQATDRRAIPDDCPQDNALYVSPPLVEDVLIAGVFTANITVSSTLPDGNFAANLWHVDEPWPCGQAPGTFQGAGGDTVMGKGPEEAALERHEVALALGDLRHRGHLEQGSDYPIGDADVMRMTSQSFATRVEAGERLVLAIGGGDIILDSDPRKPVLTVHTGPETEGELLLNVVEGHLAFEGSSGAESLVGGVVS